MLGEDDIKRSPSVQKKVWAEVPCHHRREDMGVVLRNFHGAAREVKVVVGNEEGCGIEGYSRHKLSASSSP